MAGVGLQWRLGEYFKSRYVDPYLRAGINYMYKGFDILYEGSEGLKPDDMSWILNNYGNKEGRDRRHLMPVSLGGGINFWLKRPHRHRPASRLPGDALQARGQLLAGVGTHHLAHRRKGRRRLSLPCAMWRNW